MRRVYENFDFRKYSEVGDVWYIVPLRSRKFKYYRYQLKKVSFEKISSGISYDNYELFLYFSYMDGAAKKDKPIINITYTSKSYYEKGKMPTLSFAYTMNMCNDKYAFIPSDKMLKKFLQTSLKRTAESITYGISSYNHRIDLAKRNLERLQKSKERNDKDIILSYKFLASLKYEKH